MCYLVNRNADDSSPVCNKNIMYLIFPEVYARENILINYIQM